MLFEIIRVWNLTHPTGVFFMYAQIQAVVVHMRTRAVMYSAAVFSNKMWPGPLSNWHIGTQGLQQMLRL